MVGDILILRIPCESLLKDFGRADVVCESRGVRQSSWNAFNLQTGAIF